ncbi:hypothetical protein FHG87_022396, partial [Trinorchestia longiramus]
MNRIKFLQLFLLVAVMQSAVCSPGGPIARYLSSSYGYPYGPSFPNDT